MNDNFDFHIMSDKAQFYHKKLVTLINSLEEKDKLNLENITLKLCEISQRDIKLCWSGAYHDLPSELKPLNLLTHINTGNRESLDIIETDGIKDGYLTYYGHNLNEKSRACVYSIALKYVSILSQKAMPNNY